MSLLTRPPGTTPATPAPRAAGARPDVDSVREAIRGTSRRTVVRSGAWSVPVVAVALAAPAFAASSTICSACNGSLPVNCTVNVVVGGSPTTGPCNCATGLVCATVGPLNLANVCVAAGLTSTSCGSTTCTGVCVAAGGAVVNAVNALAATLDAINVVGCGVNITGFLPSNICAVPVTNPNAGTFGALCIVNSGSGVTSAAIDTAIAALGGTVGGLAFARQCASPYSCRGGIVASAQGSCVGQVVNANIGFCQC